MSKNLYLNGIEVLFMLAILAGILAPASALAKPIITSPTGIDAGDAFPVANDQTVTTAEEQPVAILLTGSDADADPLTYTIASLPANGVLQGAPPDVTYTPNPDFFGSDSFTFKASDGEHESSPGTVSITVTGVNDAPVAVDEEYAMSINTTLVADGEDSVLANDSDVDSEDLSAILVDDVDHGLLNFREDGSFIYKSNLGYTGWDSFTYRVFDGLDLSLCATATISVTLGNTPPDADADTYEMLSNLTLTVDAADGLLANDTDVDGDALTAELIGGVAFGTLTFHDDGSFIYVPNPDYIGEDHFTYEAYDGEAYSISSMVTIVVSLNPNRAPEAVGDAYRVDSGSLLAVPASSGVLVNDSDSNGDTLTAELVSTTAHGDLTLNPDGSFTYTPQAGFYLLDQFSYCSFDGQLTSDPVTVEILVLPPNKIFLPSIMK